MQGAKENKTANKTIALVVAAGRGIRFAQHNPRTTRPKQYSWLYGKPLLTHCLDRIVKNPAIDHALVVIHHDDKLFYQEAAALCQQPQKILSPVVGGADRQDSVYRGLLALAKHAPNKVLIHDAARPYVRQDFLNRLLKKMASHDAVIPTIPLHGALKEVVDDMIVAGHSRKNRHVAQTPQGFTYAKILAAHQKMAGRELDDDAAVWELTYPDNPAMVILGDMVNNKITTRGDIDFMKSSMTRTITTLGIDVHRFDDKPTDGAHIMLGGIAIPAKKPILAHSDGDIILHALTDAILGGLGAGDIGIHFPPSDPQWRGVASHIFLEKALGILKEKNGSLVHVDISLLSEQPKIMPYREKIIDNLAGLLQLRKTSVGLKATTAEKMGALGRGEGIMAFAQVTLALPDEID